MKDPPPFRIVKPEAVAEQSHQAHRSVLVGDVVDFADPKPATRRDRLIILKLDQAAGGNNDLVNERTSVLFSTTTAASDRHRSKHARTD